MNTSSINAEFRRDTNKSPSELEREIDMTRANLESTLEALEHRLSPSDMLGQLWSSFRQHGGEFGGNLGETVKAHPMPALLTTIGIAWMMASNGQRSTGNGYSRHVGNGSGRHRMREAAHDSADRMRATGARMKDKLHRARDAMHRSRNGAREGIVGARERLGDARERLGDARERIGDARERLGDTAHSVGSRARALSETARYRARRAGSGFTHMLEEQPLLLGAIGLAAGVIAGAALPPTEQEDRAFGPMRDRTLDKARQAGAEGAHRAREQVERVAENAREKIESESNGHHSRSDTRQANADARRSDSGSTSAASTGDSGVSSPSSSSPPDSDAHRTSSPGTGLGY